MPNEFRAIYGRWKLSVLILVHKKPIRFNKIKQLCNPISSNSLARCLKQMEKDGLVIKKESTHVTYHTTPVGAKISKLMLHVSELLQSLNQHVIVLINFLLIIHGE
jgi:DNA-binding HxlR family transcriptional regulator